MKIFRNCLIALFSIAFPLFVVLNAYFFLISVNPSFNFLSVRLEHFANVESTIEQVCPYGGTQFFGLTSFKTFLESLDTDRTPKIIRGLTNSFYTANWIFNKTVPSMPSIDNENLLSLLNAIYIVVSLLFQPLVALGWLVYAIFELAVEIDNFLSILWIAFGGGFNSWQCYTYPQV